MDARGGFDPFLESRSASARALTTQNIRQVCQDATADGGRRSEVKTQQEAGLPWWPKRNSQWTSSRCLLRRDFSSAVEKLGPATQNEASLLEQSDFVVFSDRA